MELNLLEVGEIPEIGLVPSEMYAAVIRRERYGEPKNAFKIEKVTVPKPGVGQVLVFVMAAGINYNNVWASLGKPVDVISSRLKRGDLNNFHIGGSEGSGVVWDVGPGVRNVSVGDEVILSGCRWDESAADIRNGADPMTSITQTVWGYEENFGSFAQYTVVDEYQCHPKPKSLSWEQSACLMVSGATAYRQLCGWTPNTVKPGDPVLIWGGAGGLGSMAIQITKHFGGLPIAVVSSEKKADYCMSIGARGTIDRRDFGHWGRLPDIGNNSTYNAWNEGVKAFREKFWSVLGERRLPKIVFEHSGQDSLPTSIYMCDNAGMVVICGGTSGYNGDIDLRFLWMRQKRLQGSHSANTSQCRAIIHLAASGQINPCLSLTLPFSEVGEAHQMMRDNRNPPGNMVVLVGAPRLGMTSLH